MLSLLRINDYAIIDQLEIELCPGFTVMTGETGAGKSILVDAVGLALGDRADASAVRVGANRAEISLLFELTRDHPAFAWLAEHGLDNDDLCSLRRSITAEGRSRAFINNQPVTLKDLRAIGELLVEIQGQHAHQSLLSSRAQREMLDANAGHGDLVDGVAAAYGDWQLASRELDKRSRASAEDDARLDLLRFQLDEIEKLGLASGDVEALQEECERLRHVDELRQAIGSAADCLYESESGSAHSLASLARKLLEPMAAHDHSLTEMIGRLTSTEIELKELGHDLSRRLDLLEADPARLEEIESLLGRVQAIARRHRLDSKEVPALAATLRQQIEALDSGAVSIAELQTRRDRAEKRFRELAAKLSVSRHEAGTRLAAAVTTVLRELGLPAAEFRVAIRPRSEGREDSNGIDRIEFEVTTNPGMPPGPIDRVASGGELSRIGLALAVVATDPSSIPTLIFDEVDSGIGGGVAEVVGRRLREIAGRHQVLCVTHLPQVASQGGQHFRILKLTDGHTSRTQVRALDGEQRVDELSRMLGGIEITAAARAHAEEMIRQASGN